MPDIRAMIKAIKLSWIKRLVSKDNNFTGLARARLNVLNLTKFLSYKNDLHYLQPDLPSFYKQILDFWYEIYSIEPISNEEVQSEVLWHNKFILIGNKLALYTKWMAKGISRVNDIIINTGHFKTIDELYQDFNIRVSIMDYNRLKSAIPLKWKRLLCEKIDMPAHTFTELSLKVQNNTKTIENIMCKEIYWELINKTKTRPTALNTWEEIYFFIDFEWEQIFKIPYEVARETSLQSLQYQIINRYYPCAKSINKWYPNETSNCTFCQTEDSLEHYFCDCDKVRPFWIWFKEWINELYQCNITLSTLDLIFGITNVNKLILFDVLNLCILFAKDFIKKCKQTDLDVSTGKYKSLLRNRLNVERLILIERNEENIFVEKWQILYNAL